MYIVAGRQLQNSGERQKTTNESNCVAHMRKPSQFLNQSGRTLYVVQYLYAYIKNKHFFSKYINVNELIPTFKHVYFF